MSCSILSRIVIAQAPEKCKSSPCFSGLLLKCRPSTIGVFRPFAAWESRRRGKVKDLLADVARRAARYVDEVADRSVVPTLESVGRLSELGGPLPDGPTAPSEVLALLDQVG